MWLAGQGTTSTTLYAGFVKLVQVILKIREELTKVTQNSRDLSLQDRRNTPYLNATIAEIQRHASILNVNFWRLNQETIDLHGYQIEPGTWISAQLGALHVNEELFENPKKFYPERFLRNEKLLQQIIPFGIGKRSCVGEQIARTELYLVRVSSVSIHSSCFNYCRLLATSFSDMMLKLMALVTQWRMSSHSALQNCQIFLEGLNL